MLDFLTAIAALLLVLALLVLTLWGLKRLGLGGPGIAGPLPGAARRLTIIETLPLSATHRAIILRMDGNDHLVIISPQGQTVVNPEVLTNAP